MSTSEQDLWVESGRGQMPFKERQCREKTVSLWLKRTKPFFTVTKNQDFGLFPKGRGNFHLKWYIACLTFPFTESLDQNCEAFPLESPTCILSRRCTGGLYFSPELGTGILLQKAFTVKVLENNFYDSLWNKQSGATIWNMASSLCKQKYQTTHRN